MPSSTVAILVLLLVGAIVAPIGMFMNAVSVYLVFEGGTPRVTHGAEVTYQALAAVGIALAVAGVVFAFVRRRVGFGVANIVVLLFVLGSAVIFAVPHYTSPEPTHTPLPSNYVPCYTGSNDCPGG